MIEVEPTRNLSELDEIYRLEEIYDRVADDNSPPRHSATLAGALENQENLFVKVNNSEPKPVGFFMFVHLGNNTYEVHTNMTKKCRGKDAVEAGNKARDLMFLGTKCIRLVSQCPETIPESLVFARSVGFRKDFCAKTFLKGGVRRNCTHVSMDIFDWMRKAGPDFQVVGDENHDKWHDLLGFDQHEEDPAHNQVMGIAMTMAAACQPRKAEWIYNQFSDRLRMPRIRFLGINDNEAVFKIYSSIVGISTQNTVRLIDKCQQE